MPRLHQVYFSRLNDHNLDSLLAFEHLSQLTTLSFRATQSWKDVDDSYDVSKLAEVLRRAATSLSTLHICGNFHGSVRHSIDSDIVLPKLRDMELDTKEDCWLPLLPRLTTPGMLFRVDIHLGTEAALQHANLLTAATRAASMISAASHSSPPPAPQLQVFLSFMHVARYLEEIPEVWFVAFGGVDISEDKATQGPRNHCLAYSYSFHLDTKSALTFLSAMLADLRPQIEHLSIFRGEYWPPTILNEIAGLFTAVEDVLFGGFTLPHITSALAAHPALLPNLRTIRLVECSICNQCQPSRPGTFCGCGQAMAVFAALLMHRRALGVPVRRASFVRCWQTRLAEQEAALAAIVPEFSVVDPQV
ncbi:hypothetical protein PsYK624_057290 [Phanerochaete sordida]|uniref:Uncharacterized protein n=1 Tax=Phanerochaete sordida TaxID=48140 RepID=A0A9P3G8Y2_9APHY|nr:hypothetical protein PsYK624_057290 [Phanerochaete sordida]